MNNPRMLITLLCLLQSAITMLQAGAFRQPRKMVINKPVVHLMNKPGVIRHQHYEKCTDQVTQLIFGEHVMAYEELNGRIRVKSLEQHGMWKGKWISCSGWIEQDAATCVDHFPAENVVVTSHTAAVDVSDGTKLNLSFATYLQAEQVNSWQWQTLLPDGRVALINNSDISLINQNNATNLLKRTELALRSTRFLADPYLWGGRSAYNSQTISGIDCSGLVNLLYRSIGVHVPRASHDQYTKAKKIERLTRSSVGDLVFVHYQDATGNIKKRISHVMMYLGNDRLLEAEGDFSGHVRVVLGKQRFGKPIEEIMSGQTLWQYKMLARSPLGNKKVLENSSPLGKCKIVFGTYL